MNNSCIYNGMVSHTRFKPVKHHLKYKTFSLLVDLDEIEKLDKDIPILGRIEEAIALKAEVMVLGTAPSGGRLPQEWLKILKCKDKLVLLLNPLEMNL